MIFTKNHEIGIILFGTDSKNILIGFNSFIATKEGQAICEWDL